MANDVTNVVIAGLGGQGIIRASDILADAAFYSGFDVKKSEIHGMSQRGGSVSSDVRFGKKVWSPMIPMGEADFLVLCDRSQREVFWPYLKEGGVLISVDDIPSDKLPHSKTLNTALLGVLSTYLPISLEAWERAITLRLGGKLFEANRQAFDIGRSLISQATK
ncbi:Indolepyruvate oxidoreductase subunit IorB [Candidatus Sumerlaea chitinivorans]|uniref:Indolepyruvate oxidoreductase subunit IorB n=1 Tax=Sumerlaea chitinivorans TaxID=2250252 RepID=A0A2Z4Y5L6_SUMC1|nr:Indolepyruvate oxidoreductase subunit IorB [Candidatus Sumerlaea chitinivorans]